MKSVYAVICLLLSIFIISCSKGPGDVLIEMKKNQNEGKYNDISNYYTKGTIKALKELDKLSSGGSDKGNYINKKFAKGTDWKIIDEKVEGNNAEVTIKYTEHPIENMIGLELTFRFSKEDGDWKIDMQKELEMSLEMLKMTDKMHGEEKEKIINKMKEYLKAKE